MTSLTAGGFSDPPAAALHWRGAKLFWPLSLIIVMLAHLVAAWWFLALPDRLPVAPQPLPAILIDLTPAPPAISPPAASPPAPRPPATQSPAPPLPADIALPEPVKKHLKPAPKPKPVKPKVTETPPPAPVVAPPQPRPISAPVSTPAPVSAPASAVATAQQREAEAAAASLAARSAWYRQVLQHIARFKREPRVILREPQRTVVSFEIGRDGRLLSQHVLQSSGRDAVDAEALAWIARADPMPQPPVEISDLDLSHGLTVPVDFAPPP